MNITLMSKNYFKKFVGKSCCLLGSLLINHRKGPGRGRDRMIEGDQYMQGENRLLARNMNGKFVCWT
jgi:hypothetical protein